MDRKFAQNLIRKTIADYNRIASIWSSKRHHLPSDMASFRKYIQPKDKILDLGCGNGIFYEAVKDWEVDYTGTDVSENLIRICKERYPGTNFISMTPSSIPFAEQTFDSVFCLSVIHHIPTIALRIEFLREVSRVLKSDGLLVLSVWNIDNSQMLKWWNENKKSFDDAETNFEQGDILYPFKNQDGVTEIYRYLHCFSGDELRVLLEKSGFEVEKIKVISRGKGTFSNIVSVSRLKK